MESNQLNSQESFEKGRGIYKNFDEQFEDYLILMEIWEILFSPYLDIHRIRAIFDFWYNKNVLFFDPSNTVKR